MCVLGVGDVLTLVGIVSCDHIWNRLHFFVWLEIKSFVRESNTSILFHSFAHGRAELVRIDISLFGKLR